MLVRKKPELRQPERGFCKDCLWYRGFPILNFKVGECRRYAPLGGKFSGVKENDWCGDFEEKPDQLE